MAAKIVIEHDECIGCESCVEICPSVFRFDDDEVKAYVIDGAETSEEECVEEAIASCPTDCITKE